MGQTDSKLGTGLKSTGGSFRRESVQAYPVLVYTNFLTGPKLKVWLGKDLMYLVMPEFQDETGRGAVHYHLLINRAFIPVVKLRKIWGHGFVKVSKRRGTTVELIGIANYTRRIFSDERMRGKKKYFASRNLKRPIERYGSNTNKEWERVDALTEDQIESFYEYSYEDNYRGGGVLYTRIILKEKPKPIVKLKIKKTIPS